MFILEPRISYLERIIDFKRSGSAFMANLRECYEIV